MSTATQDKSQALADQYIGAWNETDPSRRQAIIAQSWAADAAYVDPMMTGAGHAGIDAMIAGAQAQFPGFRFSLISKVDAYGDRMRFTWGAGPAGGDSIVEGTDFVLIADERLKTVTGFLDKVPG